MTDRPAAEVRVDPGAVMRRAAEFLESVEALSVSEGVRLIEGADEIAEDLLVAEAQLKRYVEGVIADLHPLVRCPECGENATACSAGNRYCPSCQAVLDDAEEVAGGDHDEDPV